MARVRGDVEGANAVEFALLLPVLLLFIFGIIYFGFAFNTQLTLTQAAREGARLAGTFPVDEAGAADDSWYEAVFARIDDSAFGDEGLGNGPRLVCVAFVGSDGTPQWRTRGGIAEADCNVDVSASVATEPHVRVLVTRQVPIELIVAEIRTLRVRGTAVARYEGVLPEEAGA